MGYQMMYNSKDDDFTARYTSNDFYDFKLKRKK